MKKIPVQSALLVMALICTGVCAAPGKVPVRLDLHLAGGAAYPWPYLSDVFTISYLLDIDAKALIKKSDAAGRIPKKYRKFLGDEIYAGYMIIPNTFAFSINQKRNEWDAYVDWSIIGITLLKAPAKNNLGAPVHCNLNAIVMAAYHVLKHDDVYLHSIRPGLQARADFYAMISKSLSLKLSIFQNGYIPDMRPIQGKEENIMPNYTGCVAGFVVHVYTKKKL